MESDETRQRIEKISKKSDCLSQWEQGYIESISEQIERGRRLSYRQIEIVERIEKKVKNAVPADPNWEANWDEAKAWAWKTACNYYDNSTPRYYGYLLDQAKANPDMIPSERNYKKIVENKYAQRVINALREDPKYSAGDTVQFRPGARKAMSYRQYEGLKDIPLFVVEATSRVNTACAGCRIYRLLPSIAMEVIEIEERYIKKFKVPKKKAIKSKLIKPVEEISL